MKKSELKLGDWVLAGGSPIKIDELVVGIDVLSVYNDETNEIKDYFYDDLTPIPLTEEILEKNGWEKDDVQWILFCLVIQYDKVYDDFTIYVHQNGECNYLTEIEYVHELQHLLWALGIDDDLKI